MDVARFKYPPHWIPLSLLFTAMLDVDKDSGTSRGTQFIAIRMKPICVDLLRLDEFARGRRRQLLRTHMLQSQQSPRETVAECGLSTISGEVQFS
jgi:hypothetical protein